jgi:malonyl-CoA O-methyltransferase
MVDDARFHIELAEVRRQFGRAAETYDDAAAVQLEVLGRLLERLDVLETPPSVILDAGAGTGRGARALSDRFRQARVVALDIAEPMVRHARRRKPWFRRLDAVCGDATRLPLADASVDLVFSSLMLQWVEDPAEAFAEFRRVLKPEGWLLFTTFGPDTLSELRQAWAAADDSVHVNRFIDMHDLGDALLRSGFVNPVVDVDRMTSHYPDARALMRELKSIGAQNSNAGRPAGLTGRRRLATMQQAYESHRRDAGLPASWEVVFGQARTPVAGIARPVAGESRISPAAIGRRR